MSLINDALKQAGKAQKENPPPESNLQFRAAEQPPHRSYTPPAIMYVVFVVVLVLGGLLVLFALRKSPEVVKANTPPAPSKAASIPDTPASEAPVEQKANPIVFPKPVAPAPAEPAVAVETPPTATVSQEPPKLVASPVSSPADAAVATSPTTTNATVSAPPVEPPKPTKPKLQGIYYNPTRPSAVVNGRTLYVGDRVGEFHVREITKDAVTLASATQTYVLSLSD